MSIDNLLGDHTPSGVPRLTPRAPLTVKELTALLVFAGLVWGAYDKMSTFAKTSAVEKVVETQWQQQLANQHNFDTLNAKVDQLIKSQSANDADKAAKHKP